MGPGFRGIDPNYSLAQIAFHLFYAIPLTTYSWLNPAYWSLAYEFVFYIIVGLTFSNLMDREVELTILVIVVVAVICFYVQGIFDVRVLEFSVGILLMRFVVIRTERMKIAVWVAICLALGFWAGGLKIGGAVLLAAGALLFFREVQFGQWAIFIGSISYSLYLTHVVIGGRVINIGRRFGEGALYEIALIVLPFPCQFYSQSCLLGGSKAQPHALHVRLVHFRQIQLPPDCAVNVFRYRTTA